MGATIEGAVLFGAMADDLAFAVGARGRERVDRTLERVEGPGLTGKGDGERLVVIVTADEATCHSGPPCAQTLTRPRSAWIPPRVARISSCKDGAPWLPFPAIPASRGTARARPRASGRRPSP